LRNGERLVFDADTATIRARLHANDAIEQTGIPCATGKQPAEMRAADSNVAGGPPSHSSETDGTDPDSTEGPGR
jgi:hypothetical protein